VLVFDDGCLVLTGVDSCLAGVLILKGTIGGFFGGVLLAARGGVLLATRAFLDAEAVTPSI
jgi:hypothetical protein